MYLKSLSIRGFKSFADKTNLYFEPGITVVVGPNGSGKSNITDAVLWVLGEQSARSLRGSSMEDVIFAGSFARAPLGLAEVTICLDNSENRIPIEFSEVTISRRVLRTGESEYNINSSPCRLLDIQQLLSDSALGREMYSVVSQGKLEEVLNSKPEERRNLIDEIAGVLKYRRRKDKALRKMVSIEQNIIRLKDILKEVEKQIKPLKAQANQAEIYNQLSINLRDIETGLVVTELKQLQSEWEQESTKEQRVQNRLRELEEERCSQADIIKGLRNDMEQQNSDADSLQNQSRQLERYLERVSGSQLLLEEKKRNFKGKIDDAHLEIERLKEKLSGKEKELFLTREELKNIRSDLDRFKQQFKENIVHIEETNIGIVEYEEEIGKKKTQLEKAKEEVEGLSRQIEKSEAYVSKVKGELDLFQSRMQTSQSRAEEAIQVLQGKQEALSRINHNFISIRNRLRSCMHHGEECEYLPKMEKLEVQIERMLESEIKAIEGRLKKRKELDKIVARKVEEKETEHDNIVKEVLYKQEERNRLSVIVEEIEKAIDEIWQERDGLKTKLEQLKEEEGIYQVKAASLNERQIGLEKQIAGLKAEVREVEAERGKLFEVVEKSKVQVERIDFLADTIDGLLAQIRQKIHILKESVRDKTLAYGNIQKQLAETQSREERLKDEITTLQDRIHQRDLSRAQLELRVQAAVQKIVEEYNLPLERALDKYPEDIDLEQSKSHARSLKSKIAALGPINPIAIDEYKVLEDRHNLLLSQIDDLMNSRKMLFKIIKEMDKRIEGSFLQAFKEVNQNFQSLFGYLFLGGKAELLLTNPDNLLETGVDIEVLPDGRKSQKLSLLSGGERALAALAFFFAMYQTKPSPFYILDEVEAALDDVNVQRFINLLEQMKEQTQFLIITHQKRTMEAASSLYGVTMQPDGVSRIISHKVAQN